MGVHPKDRGANGEGCQSRNNLSNINTNSYQIRTLKNKYSQIHVDTHKQISVGVERRGQIFTEKFQLIQVEGTRGLQNHH